MKSRQINGLNSINTERKMLKNHFYGNGDINKNSSFSTLLLFLFKEKLTEKKKITEIKI